MKKIALLLSAFSLLLLTATSCKKSQPSYKMEGMYSGHFEGNYLGNDTIVNEGFLVSVEAIDKSTCTITGNLFATFTALVTKNGINVELVSPTDGLTQFLYAGEKEELSFTYANGGNTAEFIGTKM